MCDVSIVMKLVGVAFVREGELQSRTNPLSPRIRCTPVKDTHLRQKMLHQDHQYVTKIERVMYF